jgi:predicted secreted protein
MKKKLFLLLCVLLTMVGVTQVKAYTVSDLTDDGWTQLTTIEGLQTAITNDSYFALVSGKGSNLMIKSMSYGSNNRLMLQSIENPVMDKGFAWIFEYEESNEVIKYYLKNANNEDIYFGYAGTAPWDYVANSSYTTKTSANSNLSITVSEGKYTIATAAGGSDTYLGAWGNGNFVKGERFAGNKNSSNAEQFVIYAISKTAYAAKQQAIIDAATNLDGKDVSFLIKDANLDVTAGLSPWTGGVVITGSAANGSYVSEKYRVANTNIYQTLTGIANGKYTVSAQGTYRQDNSSTDKAILYAGTQTADLTNHSSIDVSGYSGNDAEKVQQYLIAHPETKATIENVIVTDGTLTLGIKTDAVGASNLWVVYDNFKLTYYGIDVTALKTEYENAKSNCQNALENPSYANITGSERTDLSTTLTTYATCEETQSALEEAISALNSAYLTFTDAKTSYDNLVSMRAEGATYTTVAWPRASAVKKTALDNAIVAEPTNAADAVTKTNAIVTAYRQFVESSGLAEGVDVALNKTDLLLVSDASVSTSGWTSGTIGTNTNEPYTTGEGTTPSRYFDGGWSASAGVDITLTQDLTLPAGEYQLQITARGASNLTSYTMSVGASSVDLPHIGATGGTFGRGWSDKYITFTSDGTPVTLTIAAQSTDHYQWISFNRLRLIRLDAVLADGEDYAALNSAISAADAKFGFGVGEYAPYNNKDVASKYAEAKAIDQDAKNEKEVVQALTTYLNTPSNWTTVNTEFLDAICNGSFTGIARGTQDNVVPGWNDTFRKLITTDDYAALSASKEGRAMFSHGKTYTYGNQAGYTLPLKRNVRYALSFKAAGWENGNISTVTARVKRSNGNILKTLEVTPTKRINEEGSLVSGNVDFTVESSENYTLEVSVPGSALAVLADFSLTQIAVSVTLGTNGYATFASPYALDLTKANLPSGLKAYKAQSVNSTYVHFEEFDQTVPANTGILLEGTASETYSIPVVASDDVVSGNLFRVNEGNGYIDPSYVESTTEVYYFAMIKDSDPLTFGKFNPASYKYPSNKAYLTVAKNKSPEARLVVSFDEEDPTGINAVEAAEAETGALKDGKYLIGNKVVLVKNGVKYGANGQKLN